MRHIQLLACIWKMKKLIVIGSIIVIGLTSTWYFDIWHDSVETIDELIGQNYDYAYKMYFRTDPDSHHEVNINNKLNEFDGGILSKKEILIDSIVNVYTWDFANHKMTIWVGKTKKMNSQIIAAIRYKDNIRF